MVHHHGRCNLVCSERVYDLDETSVKVTKATEYETNNAIDGRVEQRGCYRRMDYQMYGVAAPGRDGCSQGAVSWTTIWPSSWTAVGEVPGGTPTVILRYRVNGWVDGRS